MKVKFATKKQLIQINKRAIANNYNRSIIPEYLENLPDKLVFPVTLSLLHEHAMGKPVEPHVRCQFTIGDANLRDIQQIFIDVEMDLFEMLSEADVPERTNTPSSSAERKIPDVSKN